MDSAAGESSSSFCSTLVVDLTVILTGKSTFLGPSCELSVLFSTRCLLSIRDRLDCIAFLAAAEIAERIILSPVSVFAVTGLEDPGRESCASEEIQKNGTGTTYRKDIQVNLNFSQFLQRDSYNR
jgi:hypothetical protein